MASGGAASAGAATGGAAAGDVERTKELFKKGLCIDGTHTRMSVTAIGDHKVIPGDGWCLYSAFLVAFEKYTLILEGDSNEIINFEGVEAPREIFRYALASQFAHYLADKMRSDEELKQVICNFIFNEAGALYDELSQIRPIYNKDGKTNRFGFILDERIEPTAESWVYEKSIDYAKLLTDTSKSYKYVYVGTLSGGKSSFEANDAEINKDNYLCNHIDYNNFLLNLWKMRIDEIKDKYGNSVLRYYPMTYGAYDWFMAVIRKEYSWVQVSKKSGDERDEAQSEKQDLVVATNQENKPILNEKGEETFKTVYDVTGIKQTNEVVIPVMTPGSAHFNSVVYEYVPPEIDVFPANSPYLENVKTFARATTEKRKALIEQWVNEWNQIGGSAASAGESVVSPGNLPPGATLGIQVMGQAPNPLGTPAAAEPVPPAPAADDPIKEAAKAVADLMGAVATAAEELLGGKGGGVPAVPAAGGNQPASAGGAAVPAVPAVPVVPAAAPAAAAGEQPVTGEPHSEIEELETMLLDPAFYAWLNEVPRPPSAGETPYLIVPQISETKPLPNFPKVPTGPIKAKPLTPQELADFLAKLPTPTSDVTVQIQLTNLFWIVQDLSDANINTMDDGALALYLRKIHSCQILLSALQMKPEVSKQIKEIEEARATLNRLEENVLKKQEELAKQLGIRANKILPFKELLSQVRVGAKQAGVSGTGQGSAAGASSAGGGTGSQLPGNTSAARPIPPPSDDDKKQISDLLAALKEAIKVVPDGDPQKKILEGQIAALEKALRKQVLTIANLQAAVANLQEQQARLNKQQQEQVAAFARQIQGARAASSAEVQQLGAGVERLLAVVEAKRLQGDVTVLRSIVENPSTGGVDVPLLLELLRKHYVALEERVGELSLQIDALSVPPQGAAGASGPAKPSTVGAGIAELRAEIEALKAQAAGGASASSSSSTQPVTTIEATIANMLKRLDAIEAQISQPIDLKETLEKVQKMEATVADLAKENKALRDKVTSLEEKFEALSQQMGARLAIAAKPAVGGTPIQTPPSPPPAPVTWSQAAVSWFQPKPEGKLRLRDVNRLAEDVTGFDNLFSDVWLNERGRDPNQQLYAKMRDIAVKPLKQTPVLSSTHGAEDETHRKEQFKKLQAAFPDRTVLIDNNEYTVRNPYAAYKERLVAEKGFFMSGAMPAKGDPLSLNLQVLRAFAPPDEFKEYLADNNKAIAVLESLWHCANQQGADVDPKCFPARVVEELREYQQIKKAHDSLRSAVLDKTGMPVLIGYLGKLRAMLPVRQPSAAAAIPDQLRKKEETPAAGPVSPAQPLRRKALKPLTPGLGARTILVGGRPTTFTPRVIPPLAAGLGAGSN